MSRPPNDPNSPKVTAACHCGSIKLTYPKPTTPLTDCQCSICIRLGGLWAYFTQSQVTIEIRPGFHRSFSGNLIPPEGLDAHLAKEPSDFRYGLGPGVDTYSWGDKDILTCRCKTCGCVTHWVPSDKWAADKVGVNCRMLGKELLETFEVVKSPGPD
ncbi:hypothetical protein BD324DRAFT_617182 [Kockovaella imperatae]|uniref:Mss4-like protein n=1 Tax=Kockovaella imperatae TaxID=4999 RepID=A0A1Y1US10_9TREE|nr:hypothetical protein BD324DRAFT_617182 [Kockovaella imperatae]ORX40284.1 hypothetical protein BD324DRAFT_617182 [Kockovaella imperatae]